mmetsp:Transcript_158428/g.280917  ORF Transcript_158428/g.280917 Transcript_158428/m.280917 type:complete len:363 (+) Transcript_158428:51-1139(+)
MMQQGAEAANMTGERRTHQHFSKTKLCKFQILGMCTKGPECPFAHGNTELRALPDLRRTKLCKALILTGTCTRSSCSYAHSKEELRSTGASHKTKLCRFVGNCALGAKCNFAHSDLELRDARADVASRFQRELAQLQEEILLPPGLGRGKPEKGASPYSSPTRLPHMASTEEAATEFIVKTPVPTPQAPSLEKDLPAYVRVPLDVSPDAYNFSPLTCEALEDGEHFKNFPGLDFLNGNENPLSSRMQPSPQWPPSPPATGLAYDNITKPPSTMLPSGFHDVDKESAISGLFSEGLPLPGAWEASSQGLSGLMTSSFGGNMVVDQSDEMWKVTCSSQLSTALPFFPIRPVRTSESTLCTLSDL